MGVPGCPPRCAHGGGDAMGKGWPHTWEWDGRYHRVGMGDTGLLLLFPPLHPQPSYTTPPRHKTDTTSQSLMGAA